MTRYEPEAPPPNVESPVLAAYLAQELRRITEAFLGVEEILLVEKNVAPTKPRDGMIILVDGTNFDPGDGAGFYGRHEGSWVFLSGSGGASLPVEDTTSIVEDPVDDTKEMRIDVGAVGAGVVRVLTMPNQNINLTPGSGSFIKDIVSDTTPELGGDLDLNGKSIDFPTTSDISDCLDEDDMSSDSPTMLATQQSIRAYVDNTIAGSRGALVTLAADETGADYTTATAVPFDEETYDTDDIHDNVTNNTRLTVPTGVTRVRLSGCAVITSLFTNQQVSLIIYKNGSFLYSGAAWQYAQTGSGGLGISVHGPVLVVTATDYFELFIDTASDTSVTIEELRTWFAMEIIQ